MPRKKRWANGTYQKVPLEVLSIEALNRVLVMRSDYDLELQQYQARRAPIEAEKKSLRTAISSAWQQLHDLNSQEQQVRAQLAPYEVGMLGAIGKWFLSEPTIERSGRYYKPEAQPIFAHWQLLLKRRQEIKDLQSSSAQKLQELESHREYEPSQREYPPKKEARLRHQYQTFVFDISAIDIERVESIIEKKSNKVELESEREQNKRKRVQTNLGQTKAKAAAYENKQRELAKSVRTALQRQLKDNPCCPYCSMELSSEDPHADHIHPVAKGGLSMIGNMVFVCQSCNIRKGTLTLRAFLKKMDYVEAEVYERLERMGKDV